MPRFFKILDKTLIKKYPLFLIPFIVASFFIIFLIAYQPEIDKKTLKTSDLSTGDESAQISSTLIDKFNDNYEYHDFDLEYRLLDDLEHINSPYVSEVNLPNSTWPLGITVDHDGIVWIGGTKSNTLLGYDPNSMKITHFVTLDAKDPILQNNTENPETIWSIVEDKDGLIWISQTGQNPLWIFDKHSGGLQVQRDVSSAAVQMKVDQDSGDIWFTDTDQDILGVIQKTNVTTHHIHEFNLGTDSSPFGIYLSDDKIWITETANHMILNFDKNSKGLISNATTNFELTPLNQTIFYYPSDLVVLDNKLWFTEHLTNYFLEYDLDSESLTRYPTSINPRHYGTLPFWMIKDHDGRGFWFIEHFGNRIAFFDIPNTILTEYEIPSRDPKWNYISNAVGMAVDPTDANRLWFSELYLDKIGLVDKGIPVPFEISITSDNLDIYKKNVNHAVVNFTVTLLPSDIPIRNDEIFLKKSSSIVASAGFGNMTATIKPDHFSVSGLDTFEGVLVLDKIQNVKSGNYTIAVSATDGTVTKTDYVFMNVN